MLSRETSSLHQKKVDITYHGRLKTYPDGSWELLAASRAVFRESGWEVSDKWDSIPSSRKKLTAENLDRSRRRAAARVRDLALCTPFRYFVTLTFAPDKVDRYDPKAILKKIRSWLDNRVRRNGLAYVLVPELHKDGAVHFHGFFTDCDIGFVDSGTLDNDGWRAPKKPRSTQQRAEWLSEGARIVYNISDWSYGFTTAIQVYGEYSAAVGYCCKYIGKQKQKIGGRWYYSGGALGAPDIKYVDCSYYELLDAKRDVYTFEIEGANIAFALVRGSGDPSDMLTAGGVKIGD